MRAINFEAMVAANRELLSKLPAPKASSVTWNPERMAWDLNDECRRPAAVVAMLNR